MGLSRARRDSAPSRHENSQPPDRAFGPLCLLALLMVGAWSYRGSRDALVEEIRNHLESVAEIQRHRIQEALSEDMNLMQLVASRTSILNLMAEYFENPIRCKNGPERLILWHNSLLRDSSGRVTAVLASGEDITERKTAEQELRRLSDRFVIAARAGNPSPDGWMDLVIAVEDTGIGIPESDQETIFEAFRQQSGQSARRYGGSGLGLTISRRLARVMNGEITVRSEPGTGSIFELRLRKVQAAPAAPEALTADHLGLRDVVTDGGLHFPARRSPVHPRPLPRLHPEALSPARRQSPRATCEKRSGGDGNA